MSETRGKPGEVGNVNGVAANPVKGKSGNPGGRPALAKTWAAATDGKTMSQVGADILKQIYAVAIAGPKTAKDSNWQFAAGTGLAYSLGKPSERVHVELDGSVTVGELDMSTLSRDERDAVRRLVGGLVEQAAVDVAVKGDDDSVH